VSRPQNVIMDNFSPHKRANVTGWAAAHEAHVVALEVSVAPHAQGGLASAAPGGEAEHH